VPFALHGSDGRRYVLYAALKISLGQGRRLDAVEIDDRLDAIIHQDDIFVFGTSSSKDAHEALACARLVGTVVLTVHSPVGQEPRHLLPVGSKATEPGAG